MASSAVYLLNDCVDVDKDREHPTKRNRPIAAGIVSVATARRAAVLLALTAIGGGAALDWRFGVVAATYLVQNYAYSFYLKNIAYVDVLSIATGFLLRVLAGAFAIRVPMSEWLIGCTFLIALFLAMGKRRHELENAGKEGVKQRKVLEAYAHGPLTYGMTGAAMATIACYTAYTLEPSTAARFGTDNLWMTIPFIVFGMVRFLILAAKADDPRSPTEQMIRDISFILNVVIWGLFVIYLIYIA